MKLPEPALSVEGLTIRTPTGHAVVDGVSLVVPRGSVVAVVGRSGAGKSTLFHAMFGLLPEGLAVAGGSAWLWPVGGGRADLVRATPSERRRLLGAAVAHVPQNPLSALDPYLSPRQALIDAIRAHAAVSRRAASDRAGAALGSVGLGPPAADARCGGLSGGEAQRVLIALAHLHGPAAVVYDEPTTALDPVAKSEFLRGVRRRAAAGAAAVLVTHDLAAAGRADAVAVMLDGRVVEIGPAARVFESPAHAHTQELLAARLAVD